MDRDRMGGFGIGLLLGAAIGAIAGLLFAPKSGKELREELEEKMRRLKRDYESGKLEDRVRDIFGNVRQSSIDLYREAKDEVKRRVRSSRGEINQKRYDQIIDDVIRDIRERTEEGVDTLERLRDSLAREWDGG
jgi:gas vesicle protein